MKILLKILFENEAEYLEYSAKHVIPAASHIQVIPAPTPAPEPRPQPKGRPSPVEDLPSVEEASQPIVCQYKGCGNPFNPLSIEDHYCSRECERKDRLVQKAQKAMEGKMPKRGRPRIARNL